MSVRVFTKDIGDVKDVFRRECEFVVTDEDRIAEHRKRDLGVEE